MVFSVVALIPVFMYGFTVNVTEIKTTIGLSSSETTSSSTYITTQAAPVYNLSNFNVNAQEKVINAYQYVFSRMAGNLNATQEGSRGTEVVNIQMMFNLTTPSNKSLSFSFNPHDLKGAGLKNLIVLLGPNELNREVGTFYLVIAISIKVTLPAPLNTQILNLQLTPVNLTFDVPA